MNKKIIWITGASTGIGKSTAIKFANEGWIVAASARRKNLLDDLKNINENIHSFPLDVTNLNDCNNISQEIINKLGGIDVCLFSTGMHDPDSEKNLISILLEVLWR